MENENPTPALPVREIPAPPDKPPRPLTSEARRAIWLEPRVRRWWYMVLTICLLFAAFCVDRLWARHIETELIRTGQVVTAKIIGAENKRDNQPFTSSDKAFLNVNFPTGPEQFSQVYLSSNNMVGATITLHVDPNNHANWTDRSEATPLLDSLFVGLIALPILPLLMWLCYLELRSLRRLWQSGLASLAVVFDRRPSPIAPMSYSVRCTMQDLRSRDLFTVYVPRIGSGLEKGDAIWVIAGGRRDRPVAALWMPPTVQKQSEQT